MPDGIERQLSLDVSNALSSIGDINDAFLATVATFEAGLDSALAVLGSVSIGDVDTSAVDAALVASIETASATPAVIDGDASAVTDAIDLSIASADNSLEVLADTGAIPPDIEAAIASADPVVAVTADTTSAQDSIVGLNETEPIELEVAVNTADAEASIEGLGSASGEAAGSVENLDAATESFSAASEAAVGNTSGLVGAVGTLNRNAGVAAGALATLGGFVADVTSKASTAEAATNRFERSLGAAAEQVDHVDVGGLNTSLDDLAVTTGSSVQGLQNAASRLADLGRSAGASDVQIGGTVETILALSAQLAVTNPALGSTGDIADKLTGAFARGGRALAPFGIQLNKAQIEARALTDTGKATTDSLTLFDKAAAGAAIRAEQLGDRLGTDVAEGAEQSIIQFRSLGAQLEETLVSLGTPLVAPVLEVLREAEPVAEQLGRVLADLGQAVLPALVAPLQVLGDILGVVAGVIEAIPSPVLSAALAFGGMTLAVSALVGALEAAAFGAGLLGLAGGLAAINPPLAIGIGLLAAGAAAFHVFGNSSDEASKKATESAEKILGSGSDLESTSAAIENLSKSIDTLASSADGFGEASDAISEAMTKIGLTNRDLQTGLTGTSREFVEFSAQVAKAAGNQGGFFGENLKVIRALAEQRQALQDTAQARIADLVASEEVTGALSHEAIERNRAKDGTVNYTGALEDATRAAEEHKAAVEAQAQALAVQTVDWRNLGVAILEGKVGLEDVAAISEQFGLDENTVKQFVDDITKSLDAFVTTATAALPTVKDAFATFQTGISDASKALNDAATAADPDAAKIADSFTALVEASDPQRLIENVQKQAKAIVDFQGNVEDQLRAGNERVAKLLIEQGPVIGGALAQSLHDGQPKTARELDSNLTLFQGAYDQYGKFIRDTGGPQILTATGEAFQGVSGAVAANLNMEQPVREQVDLASKALQGTDIERAARANATSASNAFRLSTTYDTAAAASVDGATAAIAGRSPAVAGAAGGAGTAGTAGFAAGLTGVPSAASTAFQNAGSSITNARQAVLSPALLAGQGVGVTFGEGVVSGIHSQEGRIAEAARSAVRAAEAAARGEAQSHSPSRLFMRIGEDLVDGLIAPFADARIAKAGSDAISQLASSVGSQPLNPRVPQVSPGVLTSAGISSTGPVLNIEAINLTMQNGTEAEVRRVGGKIVDTISEELFRRGIAAEVRA